MALIDRDRLLTERMKNKYYHLPNGDIAIPLIDIERAPVVDAVPVKHGRWTDKDGGIATCSVCGERWGVWSVMQYCPSCGARMDGDT